MSLPIPPESPKAEPFELLEVLGQGAFAITYKARVLDAEIRNEYGEEIVAVKVPHTHMRRVLQREITLNAVLLDRLRKLNAPQIVRYLGFEAFRGSIVMAMEYVASGTLRDLLGPPGNSRILDHKQALAITRGLLQGVVKLHTAKVVHRDLKPENILLASDTPKIADLGVARLLATGDLASTRVGTPIYMSPELLMEGQASFPADVWAVGVVLYEMVTGCLPFGRDDMPVMPVGMLIQEICGKAEVPAFERCADVPRALSDLIASALAKDANARTTAEEMLDRIRALESPQPIAGNGAPPSTLEAPALVARAVALIRKGQSEDALVFARRAREVDPKYADAWNTEGVILCDLKRYDESLKCMEQALALAPTWVNAWNNKGRTLRSMGRTPEALACYEKAIECDPDESFPWGNKGSCLLELRRHEDALRAYERALELEPNGLDKLCGHGRTLLAMERLDDALESAERAYQIDPKDADVRRLLGGLLRRLIARAEAADDADEVNALQRRLDELSAR